MNSFINDDVKDAVSKKLSSLNRFGADFNWHIDYSHKVDSFLGLSHCILGVKLLDRTHLSSRFSEDAFELYFRGNKNYVGKTADLSDFRFNSLHYQELSFSLGHWFRKGDNLFEWNAGIGIVKGQTFLSIEAPRANIFTSPSGDYLDLDANLTIQRSDSSKSNLSAVNGVGAAFNLAFKWQDAHSRILRFEASGLGVIGFNSNSSIVTADTSFRFEGIDVSDLFNFHDSIRGSINLDSSLVQPYLKRRDYQSKTLVMPANFLLSYTIPLASQWTMEAGLLYTMQSEAMPMIFQVYSWRINEKHTAALRLRFGGYSGIHFGLSYKLKFKSWRLGIGSDYIDGFLNPHSTAQGAFLSLGKYF